MSDSASDATALKDEEAEHPIAAAWRPMLREVVRAFVEGDYGLAGGVAGVEPVSRAKAEHIRAYVAEYGATLIDLPDDTWRTSVAQWMGKRWDILVDLWTAEEGRSDLVLEGWVEETDGRPRLTIHMVYVP
jgi:hypothetical protein